MYNCGQASGKVHKPHQILEACIVSFAADRDRMVSAVWTDTFGLEIYAQNLTCLDACGIAVVADRTSQQIKRPLEITESVISVVEFSAGRC